MIRAMIRFLVALLLTTILCGSATADPKNELLANAAAIFTGLVHRCLYSKATEFQYSMLHYVIKEIEDDPKMLVIISKYSNTLSNFKSAPVEDQRLQCPMVSVILPALELPHRDVDVRKINEEILNLMFKNVGRKK